MLVAGDLAPMADARGPEGQAGGNTTRLLLDADDTADAALLGTREEPAGRMAHVKHKMRRLTMAVVSCSPLVVI